MKKTKSRSLESVCAIVAGCIMAGIVAFVWAGEVGQSYKDLYSHGQSSQTSEKREAESSDAAKEEPAAESSDEATPPLATTQEAKPEKKAAEEQPETSDDDAEQVYVDESGNPLVGEWRYEGVNYVFDDEGHMVAGGGSLGTKGRLYVPAAGIDVAVNRSDASQSQYYTDLEDSAAYVHYGQGRYYLSDHSTQAFSSLTEVSRGDVAYLFTNKGIEAFVCTNTFAGHNTGSSLTDRAGHDIVSLMPTTGFAAYTCLSDWTNVQITLWQRTWIASTTSSEPTVELDRKDASSTPMEDASITEKLTGNTPVKVSVETVGGVVIERSVGAEPIAREDEGAADSDRADAGEGESQVVVNTVGSSGMDAPAEVTEVTRVESQPQVEVEMPMGGGDVAFGDAGGMDAGGGGDMGGGDMGGPGGMF